MNTLFALVLSFLFFTHVSAFPVDSQVVLHTPFSQNVAPWCNGLGGGAFGIAYNFTLAAYNASTSVSELVAYPLVLRHTGSVAGAELRVLSTYESYPYHDFSLFSLVNGQLFSEHSSVFAAGSAVIEGGEPSFVTSSHGAFPARYYCAVANTSRYGSNPHIPVLAVNGDINGFYLCQSAHIEMGWTIVYRPANGHSRYVSESCYAVRLHLQGLY